ncbi:MAG: hypothetical protein KBT03_13645 [Bacteroidales bacterium]|nr:hypothetical protein [Candidatus Scybalousia scybalohippi]
MIKLIWWIIKHIIWGGDFEADFSFLMDFEEASEYLKKGYFIYQFSYPDILYVMIDEEIYSIDTKKKKIELVTHFSATAMKYSWKVLPLTEQVKLKKGD